jgi:hypothetical protein
MKLSKGLRVGGLIGLALVASYALAAAATYEIVYPVPGTCGDFISQDNVTRNGCEMRGPTEDCSPNWFLNDNFTTQNTYTKKEYVGGTRYICNHSWPRVPDSCCNNESQPPCPPSTCGL